MRQRYNGSQLKLTLEERSQVVGVLLLKYLKTPKPRRWKVDFELKFNHGFNMRRDCPADVISTRDLRDYAKDLVAKRKVLMEQHALNEEVWKQVSRGDIERQAS